MCFSTGASITAGVLLTFAGTETLRKVHKPTQIVFASIPLFFAFQQFAEGVLWLVINGKGNIGLEKVATYVFLLMAQVIWPLMVPLSVLLMEKSRLRKRILIALQSAGSAVAIYYLYSLAFFPAHAEISRMHIAYESTFKDSFNIVAIVLYLAATLVPLFVSSIKRSWILGVIMGVSFIVSIAFYRICLTSVWCFFAAVISFVIFYIIRDSHKKFHLNKFVLEKLIDKLPDLPILGSLIK